MKKEMRIYMVSVEQLPDEKGFSAMTDAEVMDVAEQHGNVFTLLGFQEEFNAENIDAYSNYIRFIEVTY